MRASVRCSVKLGTIFLLLGGVGVLVSGGGRSAKS